MNETNTAMTIAKALSAHMQKLIEAGGYFGAEAVRLNAPHVPHQEPTVPVMTT